MALQVTLAMNKINYVPNLNFSLFCFKAPEAHNNGHQYALDQDL